MICYEIILQFFHSPTDGHLYCSLLLMWFCCALFCLYLLDTCDCSDSQASYETLKPILMGNWITGVDAAIEIVTAVIRCTSWRAYCSRTLLREMVRSGNCCHRKALNYSIKLLFSAVVPIYSHQEYIRAPTSPHPQLLILQGMSVFTCWWIWNISLMFNTSFSDYHWGWTLFHIFISPSHHLIYEIHQLLFFYLCIILLCWIFFMNYRQNKYSYPVHNFIIKF